ncbi:collagen alpha-1(V) chain-like [Canis lupus familiaris]|uniref:collagen alpha-1(V) chain-like n=1 Tax=Canis lupus familiaris TaxID=9615 RepID=UPI0018F4170B|nr:collagen alpha-1(V) chain-like [Canis lupus familiaris]
MAGVQGSRPLQVPTPASTSRTPGAQTLPALDDTTPRVGPRLAARWAEGPSTLRADPAFPGELKTETAHPRNLVQGPSGLLQDGLAPRPPSAPGAPGEERDPNSGSAEEGRASHSRAQGPGMEPQELPPAMSSSGSESSLEDSSDDGKEKEDDDKEDAMAEGHPLALLGTAGPQPLAGGTGPGQALWSDLAHRPERLLKLPLEGLREDEPGPWAQEDEPVLRHLRASMTQLRRMRLGDPRPGLGRRAPTAGPGHQSGPEEFPTRPLGLERVSPAPGPLLPSPASEPPPRVEEPASPGPATQPEPPGPPPGQAIVQLPPPSNGTPSPPSQCNKMV